MSRLSTALLASCVRLASAQHGIITLDQAMVAGLSIHAIRRLIRSGAWTKVRHDVFALWTPVDPPARWNQRLMAGSSWLGDAGAVSHRAATMIWNLDGLRTSPIELSTTGFHQSEPGFVIHRVDALEADEIAVRDRMRITAVERTLVDLCVVAPRIVVEQALESALRRKLTDRQALRSYVEDRSKHKRRARILRGLLDELPEQDTESALEALVWPLIRERGLPLPERQYEIRTPTNALVARPDFVYPEHRLVVEADGDAFHSTRRDWQRDRSRQNALVRLGWKVCRVTWEDATLRPSSVAADLAALLAVPIDAQA